MNENCKEKITRMISDKLPKNELKAIYKKIKEEKIKEEKTKIVFILRKSKTIPTLQKIVEKNKEMLKSENIDLSGYSLWELEKKKKTKFKNQIKEDPKIFLNNLEKYELIYGESIKSNL